MDPVVENLSRSVQVEISSPFEQTDTFIQDIYEIEKACFPDDPQDLHTLSSWFSDPNNTISVMKSNSNIIGFVVARPVGNIWPERMSENMETVNVSTIDIHPQYQGQKLAGLLTETLENELRARGFKFMELNAAVSNDYASKVERHYKDRVLVSSEPRATQFGLQRFFRIKL